MWQRYGGQVNTHRPVNRVPSMYEMQILQKTGYLPGYGEDKIIWLLLNYIQTLEAMLDGRDEE